MGKKRLGLTVGRIPQGECCCPLPLPSQNGSSGSAQEPAGHKFLPFISSSDALTSPGQSPASLDKPIVPFPDTSPVPVGLCDLSSPAQRLAKEGKTNNKQASSKGPRSRPEIVQSRFKVPKYPPGPTV